MAFLHQLRLLLWKNGLAVIRQPLWSLTLIGWPLVIFIIIAVTRRQFPPIVRPPCFVGPRNLPSTGFFPFLQTLMCNTDSHCHNTSRLVDPALTRSSQTTSGQRSPAAKLFQGEEILNFPLAAGETRAAGALLGFLEDITGLHQGGRHHNASLVTFNTTLLEDNETLHAMLESVNMLKQAICPMMLPKISKNQTARPLSFAMGTFCTTDKTMLEVSLNTLNQVLMEMMLTRPDQLATLAGTAVVVFDQLQNQTSLWESLLAIPELFHSGSADEVLDNAENLLTNLQSTLTAIQNRFPETEAPLSAISPIFAISLSVIHYAQNWPGRGVLIPLGELVKVEDDFLSEMVQKVLYGVHIPLDKVIALSLDPDTLNGYVCNNSDNPLWLTAACSSGTVRTLFDWVDSNKAAKQSLLAWSKHVAPHDLSFAKWLLNSLMGEISPGGPGGAQTPRTRRSVETQPQNIDEELFLWVGEVVLEILRMIPEADQVVRSVLRSGFQSMEIATLSLETLGGIMDSVLKDADHLKQTFHTLASDAWKASAWISDVLDSGVEAVLMIVASEGAACEDVLSLFEWLLNSEAVPLEVLRSAICGSDADLQQALLTGLMPLLESAQDFNSTITGQAQSNVSLPVILSEWQRLNHVSQQLLLSLDRLAVELGGAYWMNWMPGDCTHDVTGTLQQSVFLFMVKLGGRLERSQLWCVVKNYVHMADWVLNYQPGVSAPLNCSVDVYTADVCCHIEKPLNWSQFLTSVTQTLMNPDQQVLVNSLKGAVNLLQHVYSDALNSVVGSFLEHNIHGGEVLTHFLINMVHNLQDFVGKISILPDENFTDPNHVGALVSNLLQSSGLSPLLPLLFGDGPLNVSTVLHVATEFLKQNQLIFTSNETDPTMLEVEQLIKHFLSLEGNLTMSLSNFMGHSLISFVGYFNPDDVAQIMELIRPFTSQTSAGIVQAVIRVMELLRAVTDAPDGDPTNILLGYIHQLQNFAASLFRLRRVQKYMLPNGELNASQITDLHFLTKEFLDLLSPEGLQGLISAGPDAARSMVALKLIHFLPAEAQQEAARLLQDFRVLQHHVAKLAAGQDCLTGISEIFAFLNQILDTVLTANANVAIQIAVPNFLHMDQEDEEIACILFPLLLPPNEAGYVKTFKQALHFVKLTMATPNITISGVHDALQQSNLTLEELNNLASLFGAVDTDDLMVRLMDVINSQKCFEPHQNQMVTAQCVLGLVRGVTHFLTQLPGVQNETTILNLIPLIVNTTIKDVAHVDFTNPNAAVVQTLNRTLANVKMGLQVKQLSTPEIRREIKVLEGLIHLATDPEPFDDIFNSTMTENPISAQKIYLEMIAWYLKRLENVISSSSLSELLHPFFKLTQMQVSLQLAQTDFTLFVSRQIEKLLHIFQHPINSAGVEEIGQIALEMFQHLFQLIKGTLDFQNNIPGVDPLFDPNILHAVEFQMKQYLDATQDLLEQPNFLFLLASMLSSANSSIDPQKCFEPHQNQMGTAQCVLGLVSGVTSLLTQMPGGQNEAVLSQIPLIVNSTIKAVTHVDFTNPNAAVSHVLNTTMANVKVGLQQANQSTEEIMGEIRVLESLIALAADPEPFNTIFNSTLAEHPTYAQKMYLDMINWFLKEMQSIIKDSSLSDVLHPFLYVTQRQVSLQLVQTEFTLFVSNQIQQLMGNIQHPISGAGVGKIGDLAVEMFQRLLQLVKGELELQNNIPGVEPFLNTTVLHAVELQIEQNLERIQKWMNQPVVSLILANMLQWGNPYINVSSPFTDLHQLLETMFPLFNAEQLTYLSIIRNITHFLSSALQASEQPCGFHSDQFTAAIMEAIQNCIKIVTAATRCPAPPNLEQNILDVVNNSLKLILQQDMNFDSSRIISIHILEAVERIIQQILPEVSEYLLPGIKIVTTYFESSLVASGPENWNQLILNEMKTVLSLLPPNSPARVHVSTLINVTVFILESGRGNMSLWSLFESASAGSIPMIIGKMGKLLDMLWPIITGHPGPSLQDFVHLVPVLEQVATGMAGQDTWDELENIVEASLSLLKGTELWETVSSLVPPFEKIIESLVKNMQAENAMVLSLQGSMVTLVTEIVHTVNSSRCNLTEVSESIQAAVEHTVQAVQQANGTLECSAALQVWGPVGEAVGLSHQAMTVWCSTEVQPVLDAYYDAQMVYSNLNMSHMNMGAMTVDATAERIVKTLQSIYQVSWNRSYVAQDLISAFSGHLSALTGRPLSAEAQRHWLQQLHKMQMLSSLSSLRTLTDGLLMAAPSLQPYIEAVEKAARHVLSNYREIQDSGSSEDVFEEAIMIFLHAANITSDNIFSTMKATRSLMDDGALTSVMRQAARRLMKVFEDVPMAFHGLEHFLESIDLTVVMERLAEMVVWLASTEAYAMDLLAQTLPELYHVVRPLTSAFYKALSDVQAHMGLFEDLADNLLETVKQFVSSGGLLGPENYYHSMYGQEIGLRNHTKGVRRKRDAPRTPAMNPVDDFIYLFLIDYHSMFRSLSEAPSPEDIMGTVHSVFANRDLNIVVKGVTRDMPWILNTSREDTIDAAVEMLSFLTLPRMFDMSAVEILQRAADLLPDGFPFALIKRISSALTRESQENLRLMEKTIETAAELLQTNMSDPGLQKKLDQLSAQLCSVEETETVHMLMSDMKPGFLCFTLMPLVRVGLKTLTMNSSAVVGTVFETVIGDPRGYNVNSNWTTMLSQGLSFNISNLNLADVDVSPPGAVTVGEVLRDEANFIQDVQQHMNFDPAALRLLMDTPLPESNLMMLTWLVSLRHCNSRSLAEMEEKDATMYNSFCTMSVDDWFIFSVLMARHLHTEKVIYEMVLPEQVQGMMGVMLQVVALIDRMARTVLPAIGQLQSHLSAIEGLDLMADKEFHQMSKGLRSTLSTKATFVTLSRALCSNGILALFGISKLPLMADDSSPSSPFDQKKEDMIQRFKIPRDASPFCMNMYLDMVNTTGGAIAWAFLKPMLMGQILFTPDTPVTRDIMKKSNATLEELANLRKHSREWLDSSHYILKSAEILSYTLPMLQNSLGNSFVKKFIEMQTDINVDTMKETLSNFSNMTLLLERNKQILNQITTLSTLMVNLSSCIKFDRYRGYNSAEELDADAQKLAKDRNLYASVIFKLPKDSNSSRKRREATSSLPPKVSYTIRMHMDNVMRTDRVRTPFYIKYHHISAKMTMRYNRGFIYMQENIDRAIISAHAGQTVTEPAVQLQPFPYPCHHRDEYLESISYVFPLMLMLAWVLFVADFVKRLVYERELRLHEYMKMMGVDPLSHFFAWFIECALYLLLTIFILTLVLKYGAILPSSDGFLLFLYLCDYGFSILAFSFLVSSFFDKTFIAGLSGSLLYILFFFPFIVVMAVESNLTFTQKSILSLFSPSCFSYASQYISRYEAQTEGIQWSNSYKSPITGDEASFGWLCWLMLLDSILYFLIGAYIRMVFPGKYGIPAPWYFPFKASFWAELCCCATSDNKTSRGLLFANIMQKNPPVFFDDKGKGRSALSSQDGEDFSHLPVGVTLHGLSKLYGDRVAIQNLNVSFYEGHVTSLLGHNGAGKTTTMSLLTGLFAPTSGSIEVYGRDMQTHIDDVRKELGVCMQYDVLFDHMTAKEHLLLYGQIKAPHWSKGELREQIRTILEETGMYAHRHKRVGTLSGGMKRKLSISIAFIGGSRLVVLDEPTTGVDPCSRRSIWDIIIQYKKHRTIIMSTHHLDEAEVLSDRITFLERGGLKCCGSPFHLKDKLGQGYKLTLTKKLHNLEVQIDSAELKSFIQAHVPEARLREAQGGDLVYSLPPFNSANASSYRSLLTALDSNLDTLQLGGYGVSDTTLEEVFLQLAQDDREPWDDDTLPSVSEKVSDTRSVDSFPSDTASLSSFSDNIKLTGSTMVSGVALAWQQLIALLMKRFHHSRRDWKGLISQILLPVLFMAAAMGLGCIKSDLQHYPELELSPALYRYEPSYSFFSNHNPKSEQLIDAMLSSPGIDNECLNNPVCSRSTGPWRSSGNSSKAFRSCKCTRKEQICESDNYQPPHRRIPSSQILYNLSGINVENYLVSTANDFIRNRYGGFAFGMPLPRDLKMDIQTVPKNRTVSKVWFNPEGHHTMPAYLNSINNLILRANLPADKDPRKYAISVSSHPYFGRPDDEDTIVQGLLQILVAMCVMTGYSITTASFAIYVVSEHHTGSKRLQHIAGVSELFYWVVNFGYDMVVYMIPVVLTVAVVAAFQVPAFTYRQNLAAVTLLLVLFGFSTFPWMYLLSGMFKDAEMAFITFVCINLFISVNTIMSTSILYFLSQLSSINPELVLAIFHRLCKAFLIFPQFSFGHGLMQLARKNIEVQILSGYGVDAYINPFSMEGLGWLFISSIIQGVVLFSLRLLLNKFIIRRVRRLICGGKTVPHVSHEEEDEDVATEHQRVASGAAGSDILQVNQLTKVYQSFSKKVQAVKRVSVGIPAGECFGLLGVNGAGKTTTFKMLTGDVSPTAGTAQIRDQDGRLVDIMACRNQGINIGYCPQVDALDNLLTGEEHLYFYARIRGISKREIDRVVRYLLRRLELHYHRNITTDGYSCGTRRKLSTALALIGNPQILLLDEPSSGMDPRTKRHLWKIISEEVKGKCAVVLTSHSMEECEALCSRLAIMVKGQFRCLGSLQHIKNRFGSGFTVKMYLAGASCDAEAITGFMQRRFPSTYLKDQHSNMVEFHVPVAPGGVADIFDQLESNKSALQIKHFSVSQTTLDEVFINFAMEKTDNMENISINHEDGSDSDSVSSISAAAT